MRVAPEDVRLVVWPLVQQPVGSLLALGATAAAGGLVGWSTGQAWSGAIAAAALAITLWRTWLPVTYELGPRGITQKLLGRRRRIDWLAIRSYEASERGVLLAPDPQMTALSPLRGLYLPWVGQREQVLAILQHYLPSSSPGSAPQPSGQ
ncbi:MAG: hypothetical protein WD872_10455 [Pirellulaceae bacterium]